MLKGINYWAFLPQANGGALPLDTAFRCARDFGYDCFELTVDEKGPLSLSTTQAEAETIRKAAEDTGIKLGTMATLFSWSYSPTDPDIQVRNKSIEIHKRILEIASWFGIETILYIPGMVSAWWIPGFRPQPYDLVDQWAREAIDELLPVAEMRQVKLAIENVANRFLISPLEMKAFIDSFQSDYVGSYFDIGNALIYGYPEHWIKILDKRIFAVHLKDFRIVANGGYGVDLLGGDVNYPAVMRSLDEAGYSGPYTVEIVPARPGAIEKATATLPLIERMSGNKQ